MNHRERTAHALKQALPELQAIAKRLKELGDLEESAKEHGIPLSPDTIRREGRDIAAKLRETLVRWEKADPLTGDEDDDLTAPRLSPREPKIRASSA
jgi:hypothetical protein